MDQDQGAVRNRRIAMLIDGDNAQPSLIRNMLAETSKYGLAIIRRIYGDWTTANMNGWKDTLQTHAIQPIQQFRYTIGKNATDSAMIIDAMDILYEDRVEGFCLVSSDSDYTRLATRIREKGVFVMGIGRKTTPRAFVNACDVFVFTENLQQKELVQAPPAKQPIAPRRRTQKVDKSEKIEKIEQRVEEPEGPAEPLPLIKQAFDLAVQDDGWAFLGVFILWFGWYGFNPGSTLSGMSPDIGRVAVTTTLGGAAGAVAALIFSWIWFKKPDASMTLNGVLAGLVAITAPCAVVSPGASIVIGLIAGVLVVLAVEFFDKLIKVDDPVGAVSVHLVNGVFGTLAVGIWGNVEGVAVGLLHGGGLHQLGVQALGVATVGAWAGGLSLILFLAIKAIFGLRVTAKEEMMGLDLGEHKSEAYSGFQIFSNL